PTPFHAHALRQPLPALAAAAMVARGSAALRARSSQGPSAPPPSRASAGTTVWPSPQRWCCIQKRVLAGGRARTGVQVGHSINSKRPGEDAWPTTEACPKFWGVISCQQRLQTGGSACNRVPPVGGTGWYAISPTQLIGIVFSKRWRHDLQSWPRAGAGAAS